MAEAVTLGRKIPASAADMALKAAAGLWFLAALAGQWAFVYYIAVHYGGTAALGNLEGWTKTTLIGYLRDDLAGNLAFAAHVLMAATITFGGTLQLIPQIRTYAINFHRWNGRVFMVTAFLMAFGGLYLVWVRDATLSLTSSVAITLNGALIVLFATLAWRAVRSGDIATHRRWALRTFMVVNGVWFFRVGIFMWLLIHQAPVLIGKNFDGPFVIFMGFASYLLPLAILEIYLRTQDRAGPSGKLAMAGALLVLTALMSLGIFGTFMIAWRPHI